MNRTGTAENMKICRECQLILFCVNILITDATVTVTTQSNQGISACGESETVICTTPENILSMTWEINNVPAASCNIISCPSITSTSARYTFTFNLTSGIFLLNINPVTLSDNGTLFLCEDGSNSASARALVKVVDNFTATYDQTFDDDTNMTVFHVSTGCISKEIAKIVTISWYCNPVQDEKKRIKLHQASGDTDDFHCSTDPDCGTQGYTRWFNFYNITKNDTGELCKLEAEIYNGKLNETNIFTWTVRINYTASNTCEPSDPQPEDTSIIIIVIVSISVGVGTIVIGVIVCYFIRRRINKNKQKQTFSNTR